MDLEKEAAAKLLLSRYERFKISPSKDIGASWKNFNIFFDFFSYPKLFTKLANKTSERAFFPNLSNIKNW